ncbi:MAG: Asp-tRNA(Asn)/Glu-tRNA(Gln) amidotransferase subunit GatC [Chlamydiae bacterium]|nr:Asp-tRNA(Asn)/Glu-tRNA(Gln) amidotransferase subunit GatC [Chlamydiota bacterium]
MKEDFTEETLRHLSKLCRIHCTTEEALALTVSIDKILSYIYSLQEIDTEGFEPVYTPLVISENVFREDLSITASSREEFLANSPEHIGGMIRVPKVFL